MPQFSSNIYHVANISCLQGLFTHPTEDYDFVIQLEPSILPRYFQNVAVDPVVWSQKGRYANVRPQKDDLALRPSFDPAQLLFNDIKVCLEPFLLSQTLIMLFQRVYKDTLQFFYDPIGGDRIGAVWEPSVKQQRPFRVLGGFSGVPSSMVSKQSFSYLHR
jgi:U3 small nucleolar RNA-associated protein 22